MEGEELAWREDSQRGRNHKEKWLTGSSHGGRRAHTEGGLTGREGSHGGRTHRKGGLREGELTWR